MRTKRSVLEHLAAFATIGSSINYNIGVVVKSYTEAKQFMHEFNEVLGELPSWISPSLRRRTTREFEFDNGFRIIMLYTECGSKGRSINELIASSRMTHEELAPHCFTVLTVGSYTIFDDE